MSAIVIATALTITGGSASVPLIIVGVVVAYLATLGLEGRLGTSSDATGGDEPAATDSSPPPSAPA